MSTTDVNSSELSDIEKSEKQKQAQEISVTEEDKKEARGHLYSVLFKNAEASFALIPSIVSGCVPICGFFLFGKILNLLSEYAMSVFMHSGDPQNNEIKDVMPKISFYCIWVVVITAVAAVAKFFQTFCWIRLGAKLSTKVRRDLFKSMMMSDVAFFDVTPIGGILTLLSEDAQMVHDAFGIIKGMQVENLAKFVAGIILSFVYSWKLALVSCAIIPLCLITVMAFMPCVMKRSATRFSVLSKSMTIAEETISSIRTIKGFNREDDEIDRFSRNSMTATKHEQQSGYFVVIMFSIVMLLIWADVGANMYFGATLIDKSLKTDKKFLVGDMMACFMFTMFGIMGIMIIQGSMSGEQKAVSAGARILKLTKSSPSIPFDGGIQPEKFEGHIEFKNVTFRYPTRPTDVLKDVSFEVKPNTSAALVGHSGSGKSTCIQLIERYYDCNEGTILLDGRDIKEYDPRWLHRQIGLVNQDPSLFSSSIRDNIVYGKKDATDEEVINASEIANAKKFIDKLDQKYDTLAGEKGTKLSGGQKQRIAIARAIIKNPSILLCDEATSALDASSEKKVQDALDKVMENRTSVIVAHRLSTIKNAKIIYVFDGGKIVEQGTHSELIEKKGSYFNLVSRQLLDDGNTKATSESENTQEIKNNNIDG